MFSKSKSARKIQSHVTSFDFEEVVKQNQSATDTIVEVMNTFVGKTQEQTDLMKKMVERLDFFPENAISQEAQRKEMFSLYTKLVATMERQIEAEKDADKRKDLQGKLQSVRGEAKKVLTPINRPRDIKEIFAQRTLGMDLAHVREQGGIIKALGHSLSLGAKTIFGQDAIGKENFEKRVAAQKLIDAREERDSLKAKQVLEIRREKAAAAGKPAKVHPHPHTPEITPEKKEPEKKTIEKTPVIDSKAIPKVVPDTASIIEKPPTPPSLETPEPEKKLAKDKTPKEALQENAKASKEANEWAKKLFQEVTQIRTIIEKGKFTAVNGNAPSAEVGEVIDKPVQRKGKVIKSAPEAVTLSQEAHDSIAALKALGVKDPEELVKNAVDSGAVGTANIIKKALQDKNKPVAKSESPVIAVLEEKAPAVAPIESPKEKPVEEKVVEKEKMTPAQRRGERDRAKHEERLLQEQLNKEKAALDAIAQKKANEWLDKKQKERDEKEAHMQNAELDRANAYLKKIYEERITEDKEKDAEAKKSKYATATQVEKSDQDELQNREDINAGISDGNPHINANAIQFSQFGTGKRTEASAYNVGLLPKNKGKIVPSAPTTEETPKAAAEEVTAGVGKLGEAAGKVGGAALEAGTAAAEAGAAAVEVGGAATAVGAAAIGGIGTIATAAAVVGGAGAALYGMYKAFGSNKVEKGTGNYAHDSGKEAMEHAQEIKNTPKNTKTPNYLRSNVDYSHEKIPHRNIETPNANDPFVNRKTTSKFEVPRKDIGKAMEKREQTQAAPTPPTIINNYNNTTSKSSPNPAKSPSIRETDSTYIRWMDKRQSRVLHG